MSAIFDVLAENQLLLLFSVIGIGYLLGNFKIYNLSLGVSAVLFVGLGFSAIDHRLDLPEYIYIIGLVLFVYSIGLHSGPGFFSSFRKRGLRANLVAMLVLAAGAGVSSLIWMALGISAPAAVGLFCGALTNTPALAATVEMVKNMSQNLLPEAAQLYINSPVVTYGLAYPFGVLGVIVWYYIFSRIWKIDFKKEAAEQTQNLIICRTLKVTNPAVDGSTVDNVLKLIDRRGFVLSRLIRGADMSILEWETILQIGDQIVAVGETQALEKARLLFGAYAEKDFDLSEMPGDFTYRRIFVSNREAIGKSLRELDLERRFGGTITRVRRGDTDFVPSPDTILESGDRIRFVTRRTNIPKATAFFGDSIRAVAETDFLSISLGIVLGVFLGMIPIPLPNGSVFRLGFAGGPLIVALILGRIERTGPITWSLPYSANLVLRQIGLVLFLAAIGAKAGHGFAAIFQSGGWGLIAAGALITSLVTVLTIILGNKFLKMPMSAIMGMSSGIHTQPACLAYANQQAQSDIPNIWYTTVFPVSMISKIILAQALISLLMSL
jgi:putative transport protein